MLVCRSLGLVLTFMLLGLMRCLLWENEAFGGRSWIVDITLANIQRYCWSTNCFWMSQMSHVHRHTPRSIPCNSSRLGPPLVPGSMFPSCHPWVHHRISLWRFRNGENMGKPNIAIEKPSSLVKCHHCSNNYRFNVFIKAPLSNRGFLITRSPAGQGPKEPSPVVSSLTTSFLSAPSTLERHNMFWASGDPQRASHY